MPEDIYDPLKEYINVYAQRFREVAEETFASLTKEAQIDVEANRVTCSNICDASYDLDTVKSKIRYWTTVEVMLWVVVVLCVIYCIVTYGDKIWTAVIGGSVVVSGAALFYMFKSVFPRLDDLKSERDDLDDTIENMTEEAWKQMAPLNRLYDWDVLTRMMERTIPRLEFDDYFTTQRLADMVKTYGWDGSFNDERSVIYAHSGQINGNPFVICRTRKMEMGSKTYYGSKTIYWTTKERDSDGKYHTVQHSEVLTASVTADYPEYNEMTRLIYGNTAAPDLRFYRERSGLAGKEGSLSYKLKRFNLKRKARNLKNADYAMMTNDDFEVSFNTSNRNNNQQFALLFTPLAQESMMNLLKDNSYGYGDDFDFEKDRMINVIVPEHIQSMDLDMNPDQYRNYSYDSAKADFCSVNAQYFKAIYFSFAPLLCVPMYQQIRSHENIYGKNMPRHSSFWEHEALANFWGEQYFKAPDCVTHCILKTQREDQNSDRTKIVVTADGFKRKKRVAYVTKWGGDGRTHEVPVYWDEYLPVTGEGEMSIDEDNGFNGDSITQNERMNHICSLLGGNAGYEVYRRHIASKVNL